jgi:hypothetical protein
MAHHMPIGDACLFVFIANLPRRYNPEGGRLYTVDQGGCAAVGEASKPGSALSRRSISAKDQFASDAGCKTVPSAAEIRVLLLQLRVQISPWAGIL